jgi:hypothetical protein
MKPPAFLIRRARPTDMDAVHGLSQELQASDRQLRSSKLLARSLPRSHVDGLRRVDKRDAGRLFVAISPTGVIAYLACVLQCDLFELRPIAITTLAENARARRTYRALGFRESAITFERPSRRYRRAPRDR